MPFQFKTGRVLSPQISGNVSYSGVGFKPKAMFFMATAQLPENQFNADAIYQFGFASDSDLSKQRGFGWNQQDGDGVSLLSTLLGNSGCWSDAIGLSTNEFRVQSFDSDGFTLHRPTTFGIHYQLGYLALGGDDLAAANVGTFLLPSSSGPLSVNGVGFVPDFVMMVATNALQSEINKTDFIDIGGSSFGCFNGIGEQGTCSFTAQNNVSTMDTSRLQRTDKCLVHISPCSPSTVTHEAEFDTMDTDGFTLDFTTAGTVCGTTSGRVVFYLAIQGPQTKIGSFETPTSGVLPVSQSVSGVGFVPRSLIQWSVGSTSGTSIVDHCRFTMGGASAADSRWCSWSAFEDNTGNAVTANRSDDNKVMRISTATAAAGSSTTQALADFSSFDGDGYTLSWSAYNSGAAYQVIYMAFADAQAPPPITSVVSSVNNLTGNLITGVGIQTADLDHVDTIVE